MKISEAIKLIENKTGKKVILKETVLKKPEGQPITKFIEINKKDSYCLYEPGMNNWLPNFKLKEIKGNNIIFKSTEQFDDMTMEYNIEDFLSAILDKEILKQTNEIK